MILPFSEIYLLTLMGIETSGAVLNNTRIRSTSLRSRATGHTTEHPLLEDCDPIKTAHVSRLPLEDPKPTSPHIQRC